MTSLIDLSQDRSSAAPLDQDSARAALDELFTFAGKYNSSDAYLELMRFVGWFRFYSPFNAMLIHSQMPGAHFVCTARRWRKDYRREIKIGARPIVILQPMGPVLFVFDVGDTAPLPNAPPLPRQVEDPFEVRAGKIGGQLALTIENAKRADSEPPGICIAPLLESRWRPTRTGPPMLGNSPSLPQIALVMPTTL